MDGFELADAMRTRPHLAQIPIVFMTASVALRVRVAQFSKN
jgi:CheY-like chemotaxis protein